MKKSHIFYLSNAFLILAFSIFIFLNGPMTKGNIYVQNLYIMNNGLNILDCGSYTDIIKEEIIEKKVKFYKKERSKCRRLKAMTGLEYFISIYNILLLMVIIICGLLMEKSIYREVILFIGSIFILPGIILTIIYTIYNGYIFRNDSPSFIDYQDLIRASTNALILYNYPVEPIWFGVPKNGIIKTNSNGVYAVFNQQTMKYKLLNYDYNKPEKIYDIYTKYKELGSNNYNFNEQLYKKKNSNMNACFYNDIEKIIKGKDAIYYIVNGESKLCRELYYYNDSNFSFISYNKNLFDRWLTSFIFGLLIIAD